MRRAISIGRAASAVSVATGISRILGLAREITIASLFTRFASDAFFTAFRIPNLLRDLLAEGALSSAFIPTFSEVLERRGAAAAYRLASSVVNAVVVVTGIFALSIVIFARPFARSLASGFTEEKLALTADLAQVMSPFLLTVAVAAVLMGVGNAHGRFFIPALAPALFNVGVLAGGWLAAPWLEAHGWPGVTGLALGAVLGGVMQLSLQIPGVIRDGFAYRLVLALGDPAFREIASRMAPAAFAVAATYVNVVVDNQIASYYGEGPVSFLYFAFRLWMLPIGLFGIAISTANLAGVARELARRDEERARTLLATSVRLTLLLTVPAAVALAGLGRPIVEVVYEHRLFTTDHTEATAWVLTMYAVGLPGYALVKVFVPTFYALKDPWTPVRIAALVVAVKIALNFVLIVPLGYAGLPLATGIAACLNAAWTWMLLRRRIGALAGLGIGRAAVTAVSAALVMLALCLAAGSLLEWVLPGERFMPRLVRLSAQVVLGLGCVGGIVMASGLPEGARARRVLSVAFGRGRGRSE
jgi:putative peptidoglycan lipid II flippase